MLTELRKNFDVVLVIVGALLLYHLWLRFTGRRRAGIRGAAA
jgi:hypothetical protein